MDSIPPWGIYRRPLGYEQKSWIPSYEPEMRSGTANCTTIISNEEKGSPLLKNPTTVIWMNLPWI
ncbi:hypothetical protein [Bellilinea sp.]|uniref:hypothetical protein n=1 Tax=Bellilinea sp. TaxID=2838785 RepID=UPI002ADD3892|nr:hypothetical protein [Bellilinea sp.]